MANDITDEMLEEFAVTGSYDEIPDLLKGKYGDMLDEPLPCAAGRCWQGP